MGPMLLLVYLYDYMQPKINTSKTNRNITRTIIFVSPVPNLHIGTPYMMPFSVSFAETS